MLHIQQKAQQVWLCGLLPINHYTYTVRLHCALDQNTAINSQRKKNPYVRLEKWL